MTARRLRGRIENILASRRRPSIGPRVAATRRAGTALSNIFSPARPNARSSITPRCCIPRCRTHCAAACAQWSSGAGLEWLVLTATRTSETLGAGWHESASTSAWVIPGHRMKAAEEHCVPLSRRSIEILREMEAMNRGPGVLRLRQAGQAGPADVPAAAAAARSSMGWCRWASKFVPRLVRRLHRLPARGHRARAGP